MTQVKNIKKHSRLYYSNITKIGETGKYSGNGETGDAVIVNVENNKNQVNPETQAEAKKNAERADKMGRLRTKLKTAKTKVTKSLNKIMPAISLFEKYEQERGSAKRLN